MTRNMGSPEGGRAHVHPIVVARWAMTDCSPVEGWAPEGEQSGPKMRKVSMGVRVRIFRPADHDGTAAR